MQIFEVILLIGNGLWRFWRSKMLLKKSCWSVPFMSRISFVYSNMKTKSSSRPGLI